MHLRRFGLRPLVRGAAIFVCRRRDRFSKGLSQLWGLDKEIAGQACGEADFRGKGRSERSAQSVVSDKPEMDEKMGRCGVPR